MSVAMETATCTTTNNAIQWKHDTSHSCSLRSKQVLCLRKKSWFLKRFLFSKRLFCSDFPHFSFLRRKKGIFILFRSKRRQQSQTYEIVLTYGAWLHCCRHILDVILLFQIQPTYFILQFHLFIFPTTLTSFIVSTNVRIVLLRDALLARYMLSSCVCPSVCLSQAGTVPKWLNAQSRKQRHTIARGL